MNDPTERRKWLAMIGPAKVDPAARKEYRAMYGHDPGVRASAYFGKAPARPKPTHTPAGRTLH